MDGQDKTPETHERTLFMRRKRYQQGSLQKRKQGRAMVWAALWWEDGSRRYRTLGKCSEMSQGRARFVLDDLMRPLNQTAQERQDKKNYTFREFVNEKYLPFCQRKWKESTAATSKERIRYHLIGDLGMFDISSFSREQLQDFLEKKAAGGLSASVVSHLRWNLRAIFRLAQEDGVVERNPATSLMTPTTAHQPDRRVMNREEVVKVLGALDLRERLLARLAIFAGMRPGEIFGLKWRHIGEQAVVIEQRVYRGKIGTPKSKRSVRTAAFTPLIVSEMKQWRSVCPKVEPDAWVFPSERLVTPISRDNCLRRNMTQRLAPVGLEWVDFQVMRRTHASLSR
jgi:integrase